MRIVPDSLFFEIKHSKFQEDSIVFTVFMRNENYGNFENGAGHDRLRSRDLTVTLAFENMVLSSVKAMKFGTVAILQLEFMSDNYFL